MYLSCQSLGVPGGHRHSHALGCRCMLCMGLGHVARPFRSSPHWASCCGDIWVSCLPMWGPGVGKEGRTLG